MVWVIEEDAILCLEHVDRAYVLEGGTVREQVASSELLDADRLRRNFFGVTDVPVGVGHR